MEFWCAGVTGLKHGEVKRSPCVHRIVPALVGRLVLFRFPNGKAEGSLLYDALEIIIFSGFFSAAMMMVVLLSSFQSFPPAEAIWSSQMDGAGIHLSPSDAHLGFSFRNAPPFGNAQGCSAAGSTSRGKPLICYPYLGHVAITLNVECLRGSMAAVHLILQHSRCPDSLFFHFLVSHTSLETLVASIFPNLNFEVYYFDPKIMKDLVSTSVRQALEQPLNYVRNYLANLLETCITTVTNFDSS